MSTGPTERQITTRIVKALNAIDGVYMRKTHGGAYGGGGWPDLVGVVRTKGGVGAFVALEVKRPDQPYGVTMLQARELARYAERGARAAVVTSVDEAVEIIREVQAWL